MSYPLKEAQAAKALIASIRATAGEDDELILDVIEGETNLFETIDRLLKRMVEARALSAGLEKAERDLGARRRRFDERFEADRAMIEQALAIAEVSTKVERPLATFSLVKRPPKVEISNEAAIPAAFWKPAAPTLDKKAVGDALKANQPVPGACLSNAAPTLTMRFA